jgi:tRNA(Ile)-lysidine synthase TilS/MesJ
MPPIYKAKNGLLVIRPLIFARERQLIDQAARANMPTIGDEACPSMRFDIKPPKARAKTKKMLQELEEENKALFTSLKKAFENINLSSFFDDKYLDR